MSTAPTQGCAVRPTLPDMLLRWMVSATAGACRLRAAGVGLLSQAVTLPPSICDLVQQGPWWGRERL